MSKVAAELDQANPPDGMLGLESYDAMPADSATTTSHILADEDVLGTDGTQTTSRITRELQSQHTRHIQTTFYALMNEGPFILKDYELTMAKYETSIFKQNGISYALASFVNGIESRYILLGIRYYEDFGPIIFASSKDPQISNIDLATRTLVLSLEANIRSGEIKLGAKMEAKSDRVAPGGIMDEQGCKCVIQ